MKFPAQKVADTQPQTSLSVAETATLENLIGNLRAAHIVRCVNSHDELVAALNDCVRALHRSDPEQEHPIAQEPMRRARAILAKLK